MVHIIWKGDFNVMSSVLVAKTSEIRLVMLYMYA